jgi:hypothetical protein
VDTPVELSTGETELIIGGSAWPPDPIRDIGDTGFVCSGAPQLSIRPDEDINKTTSIFSNMARNPP